MRGIAKGRNVIGIVKLGKGVIRKMGILVFAPLGCGAYLMKR